MGGRALEKRGRGGRYKRWLCKKEKGKKEKKRERGVLGFISFRWYVQNS